MAKGINSFAFISFLTFLEIFLYNRIFTSHSSKIYYSEESSEEEIIDNAPGGDINALDIVYDER